MADDEKLTEKTENSSPALIDLMELVDMGGAPLSQKVTYGNVINSGLQTVVGTVVSGNADAIVTKASKAEITTGTEPVKVITPDTLAGSGYGKRTMSVLVNDSVELVSGNGRAYFPRIPSYLNGWKIIEVAANMVAGTALVVVQLHNLTQTADILTVELTIDANEKDSKDATTPAVIDTGENTLATGDRIRVDVDDEGAGTTWYDVQITAQLP